MLGSNLENHFYCQFWLCWWFWIPELNSDTMKWSNLKACPTVTPNIYGYLLFSFLLWLEDQQFSFWFFVGFSVLTDIYHFLNPKKNSYSNGNSSYMDEWKLHLAFKTNWLLQVMLWLYLTLGKTFFDIGSQSRDVMPMLSKEHSKKKKFLKWMLKT